MNPIEIKNVVVFSFYGEGNSVVQHAINEGMDAVLAIIHDHEDILVKGESRKQEDPEEKKKRLKVGQGLVPVIDAKTAVKNLLKVPESDRASYFLFFDLNTGFKYAEQLYDKGFNGNFPTEADRVFEEDRDKAKEFVKDYYPDLEVGDIQEFKKIDDAVAFLEDTEDSWVLKGYDDLCETVVPSKDDAEKNKAQLMSALQNGQKEYEKSGFLLEKKIEDALELTPQCVFNNGVPVYYTLDIELKRRGAGDTGGNCGCAANLLVPLEKTDPIVRYGFPRKMMELAKKRKGVFIWDASILIDPKDDKKYFGEFCSNRWGWDCIQTEMTMAGGVRKYLNAIVNNQAPFEKGTYGFAVRMFSGKGDDIGVEVEDSVKEYTWPLYVHATEDGKMATTGYSDDAIVITCSGETIYETIHGAYEYIKEISLQDAAYRPMEDILSRSYPGSIPNRYDYGVNKKYFEDLPFDGANTMPQGQEMYLSRMMHSTRNHARAMESLVSEVRKLSSSFSNQPAPLVNVDLSPLSEKIDSLGKVMASPMPHEERSHNILIDELRSGFRLLQSEFSKKDNSDVIDAIYKANQPLIDQNVEKLSIMKSKPLGSDKPTVISGGGGGFPSARIPHASDIHSGTATVATSGVAVPLSASPVMCSTVEVISHESNSGTIVVGGSDVVAALVGRKGMPIYNTQSTLIPISDISKIYVDSTVSGDKVTFLYYG